MNAAILSLNGRRGHPLRTFSGKEFWPLDPRPSEVDIYDIAHSLSQQCRFAGATKKFYSVAEHCVRVSWACPKGYELHGLLHDAHEAYLVDIPRPVKKMLPEYDAWADAIDKAICEHIGIDPSLIYAPPIAKVDDILLATEARDLMHGPIDCNNAMPLRSCIDATWRPVEAKAKWLALFKTLVHQDFRKAMKGEQR